LQNPEVVPQKPHLLQQTFNGHLKFSSSAYCPHSALALQVPWQPSPQKSGPKPQLPTHHFKQRYR
jgi:hypothetical protein